MTLIHKTIISNKFMRNISTFISISILFCILRLTTLPLLAAEGDLKDDLAKLQGKWKATVASERGSSIWKLELKGNKATIVIENKTGDTMFKGECDFKLESHGSFKAYTYSNLKNLTDGGDGQVQLTDGNTKSSIYKLESDTFITVSGLRVDDTEGKPALIKWEKVVETAK